jgi:enoyl-CoA hydratase/carnithine racemase
MRRVENKFRSFRLTKAQIEAEQAMCARVALRCVDASDPTTMPAAQLRPQQLAMLKRSRKAPTLPAATRSRARDGRGRHPDSALNLIRQQHQQPREEVDEYEGGGDDGGMEPVAVQPSTGIKRKRSTDKCRRDLENQDRV